MSDFRGKKWPFAKRYDRVGVDVETGSIFVTAYSGDYRETARAAVDTKTARKIAAELIRLADKIDGKASQ